MEEILVVLKNFEQENQTLCDLLLICKPINFQPPWDAFRQHNPNQRSHGLA
jgi:hypothetical protein